MAHSLEVVFHGATLLVVEHSKQPYVPMKPVVSGMGLDWAAQFTKLKANTARWGIAEIAIPTASGEQGMSCLPLRKLPGWLATISPNKVRPELREKVIAYQNEADDVLWAAWQDQQPKAEPQQMRLDYDRISPAQAQDLKEIVDAIVKAGVQTYGETWKRLQHKFRVNSYLELPATLHLDARNYLIAKLPKATPENVVDEEPAAEGKRTVDDGLLDRALALAGEVAAAAHRHIMQAVLADQEPWEHDRWVFMCNLRDPRLNMGNGFVSNGWAKRLPWDVVMDQPSQLAESIRKGKFPLKSEEMIDIISACAGRLDARSRQGRALAV